VNRFGALATRLREQGVERVRVLYQVSIGHGRLRQGNGGFSGQRIEDRNALVLEPVAVPGLQDDVVRIVFFGDPDGPFDRAYGASRAVDYAKGLVGDQLYGPGFEFDMHGGSLLSGMRRMHACCIADKR
jgi:hypothetical protein